MALGIGISEKAFAASSGVTTAGVTTTAGSVIILCAQAFGGTPNTISDNLGNTWVPLGAAITTTGVVVTNTFYWNDRGFRGASHTFTAQGTGATAIYIFAIEITGFLRAPRIDTWASILDTASSYTGGAVNSAVDDAIAISFLGSNSGTNPATHGVGDSFSITEEYTNGASQIVGAVAYKVLASVTNGLNPAWTETGATSAGVWNVIFSDIEVPVLDTLASRVTIPAHFLLTLASSR